MVRGTQVFLGRPTLNLLNQRHDTGEILESLSDRLHNLVVPLENRKDLFLHLKEKEKSASTIRVMLYKSKSEGNRK